MAFGAVAACSSNGAGGSGNGAEGGGGGDASVRRETGGLQGPPGMDANASVDAFFAVDPPAQYCGVDGGPMPTPPTGTLDCPSDKNREGCPCPTLGMTAACWPGLRVDRNHGVCKDGMTQCQQGNEGLSQAWGPCQGYQLPIPGATSGANACKCFSTGQWKIDNLSPCFLPAGGQTYALSSYIGDGGQAGCVTESMVPPPTPTQPWSTDSLTVDCEGQYKLCYTLKAGSASAPKASDCVVASVCTEAFYTTANVAQTFPPLPGWSGTDPACAAQFSNSGGYGEMSVLGKSELCEAIDNGMGGALVFNRVQYCSLSCAMNPKGTGCSNCMQGGSGSFGN